MKNEYSRKIFGSYIASAAGVALVLLILNFMVMIVLGLNNRFGVTRSEIMEIAEGLHEKQGEYHLNENALNTFRKRFQWAMLLDSDGSVIWELDRPEDIPTQYSISDVAGFTRWYLKDYPVRVWRMEEDSLLVLARVKDSEAKYDVTIPMENINLSIQMIPLALLLNIVAAILLALLFGYRLIRTVRPVAQGISDLAQHKTVQLKTGGMLGGLSEKLNSTSSLLQEQDERLQKRDQARTEWIAGVSHDIRTPLSIVMGYASQLEDNGELPQAQREQAAIIRKQSEQIKLLINDLNLASKLQYNMQPLRVEQVSPAAIVRLAATDFINSGLDEKYSLEVDIHPDTKGIHIAGDEQLLKRAVSNLIGNSLKHNPHGCEIRLKNIIEEDVCIIAIQDNGIGYPVELLKKLAIEKDLQPENIGSHGLGLTIVQQIVKIHGGKTWFENLPEGGCRAILRFPALFQK